MRLLYVEGKDIAKYKKGGWILKSRLDYSDSDHQALMLKLETLEEYEKWDFQSKCVKKHSH